MKSRSKKELQENCRTLSSRKKGFRKKFVAGNCHVLSEVMIPLTQRPNEGLK